MKKKILLITMLTALVLFMAGCTEFNQPIYEDTEGFWNKYIVWPLVSLIVLFKDLAGSYGLGIVLVTILIRLVLLPLMVNQAKSSKKMQDLQPQMKELREKYKSKDAVTQKKYQEAMQKLITDNKVNPAAGCLPVLIQMPILIGFYHAISRMNATPEINLGGFLWFTLTEPSISLAVIAAAMQFIVLRTGPAIDNPQMKVMMYFMPVTILIFGAFLPSALTLYWVIGNIISIIQNFFIYKPWEKKKVKVEPVKSGGKKR